MAHPIQLHPRIRERREPRISASALAEFIITPPDRQDDILHDARFMRAPSVAPYGDALRAIRSYCSDPLRQAKHLADAFDALTTKSQSVSFKPSIRDEAARCSEAIALFQNAENSFSLGKLPTLDLVRMEPVSISGVTISAQPDVLVGLSYPPKGGEKIGGVFFRPQKRPDPSGCKTEETKNKRQEFRREMGRYMLVIYRLTLIESGIPEDNIDTKWLVFADIRMGERVDFPSDRISREKRIKAACGQISRLWETVAPRPGDLG